MWTDDSDFISDVQDLDWSALFQEHDLGRYLIRLRKQWAAAYDFVLIDSRTGINDIGGVPPLGLHPAMPWAPCQTRRLTAQWP